MTTYSNSNMVSLVAEEAPILRKHYAISTVGLGDSEGPLLNASRNQKERRGTTLCHYAKMTLAHNFQETAKIATTAYGHQVVSGVTSIICHLKSCFFWWVMIRHCMTEPSMFPTEINRESSAVKARAAGDSASELDSAITFAAS